MSATGQLYDHAETGIRPFDIGRDLRPVAELIAEAFAHELDSRGAAALREMRVMGYMSGLLRLLNHSTGEFNDVFNGFVWIEDGAVVGNVTVQRADSYGNRWQIANVAVEPAYRGRGIATALMHSALDHVERTRGRWAVLQVYEHNTVARHLYARLGFEDVGGLAEMRLDRAPAVAPPELMANFHPFGAREWPSLYELANSQYNAQAQWWRPVRRADFRISFERQLGEWFGRTIGCNRIYRRCIRSSNRFAAALVLTAQRWRGEHKLEFWVRPERYGEYETLLVQWALAQLQEYPRWPVVARLNTDHGAAFDAFQQYGFQKRPALLTMRRKIRD